MTKEKFIEIITFIKSQRDNERLFCHTLETICAGSYCDAFIYSAYETKLIELLQELLDLSESDDILNWWIYDTNFGEDNSIIYLSDKIELKLDTAEKFYDYLTTR